MGIIEVILDLIEGIADYMSDRKDKKKAKKAEESSAGDKDGDSATTK